MENDIFALLQQFVLVVPNAWAEIHPCFTQNISTNFLWSQELNVLFPDNLF